MNVRWRVSWSLLVAGCGGPWVRDYVAVPVLEEQDWGDRLHAERSGVRVIAGPVAVFPYDRVLADGARERGQYQLFTRVAVHNGGGEEVEVVWSAAALEVPGGGRIRLVGTGGVGEGKGGREEWGAAQPGSGAAQPESGAGQPAELVERLGPGHRTARSLIPATVEEIDVGQPMVPLCDGCEYRLVVVVRVAGREERMVLPFRMSVSQPRWTTAGAFRRGWED